MLQAPTEHRQQHEQEEDVIDYDQDIVFSQTDLPSVEGAPLAMFEWRTLNVTPSAQYETGLKTNLGFGPLSGMAGNISMVFACVSFSTWKLGAGLMLHSSSGLSSINRDSLMIRY